jgi:hypothetical protein
MNLQNAVQGCESIVGSFAVMAIIVTALATMIGLIKPADTLKHCGAIVGIAIVLVLFVSVFVGLWSSMSLWQKAVIAAMGFGIWRMRGERNRPRKKRDEE